MKRGEVYLAAFRPRSGSKQRGRRPAIVLSHDAFNSVPGWRSVIVVPVSTSVTQRRRGPTAVAIERGDGGLGEDSVALCHQITTLDRAKLERPLGQLRAETMVRVSSGVAAALDLPGQTLT